MSPRQQDNSVDPDYPQLPTIKIHYPFFPTPFLLTRRHPPLPFLSATRSIWLSTTLTYLPTHVQNKNKILSLSFSLSLSKKSTNQILSNP